MINYNNKSLSTISNHLILNSHNMTNLGILHGKMGVIIYFYILSRYSKHEYYADFASILLDELISELDMSLPPSFGDGFSGIGWGIEYLVQNNYLEGDTNEVLYDIDQIVMKKQDIRRITDWSFEDGIGGIVLYTFTRLSSFARNPIYTPFDEVFLSDLQDNIRQYKCSDMPKYVREIFLSFEKYVTKPFICMSKLSLPRYLYKEMSNDMAKYKERELGIWGGMAGDGLRYILK